MFHEFRKCKPALKMQEMLLSLPHPRYHLCCVCSKRVLCDTFFISGHYRRAHDLKAGEYKEIIAKFESPPDDKEFAFKVDTEELKRRVAASPVVPRFSWYVPCVCTCEKRDVQNIDFTNYKNWDN